jgi:tetratricopeptide (TPR) repeat protein
MKQPILIIWLFLFFTITISAQKVTNVSSRQEQSTIIISFDLETKTPCKIELYVSNNGGTTWQGPLKKVNGDVGANVSSGSKSITWSVLEEFEELSGENIVFKVSADASSTNSLANNSALKLIPKDAKSFKVRGEARLATKDYKGAVADFTKAIALNPKNATLYKLRGDAIMKLDEWDKWHKANSDYSKAIALNPNYDEAYVKRGELGDTIPEIAIKDFTKAIKINPKNSTAYKARAQSYISSKNYKNALNDLNLALKLNPENPDKLLVLSFKAKIALNDIDGAIDDLTEAININPKTEKGFYYRGSMKVYHKKDTLGGFEDFNQHINLSNNPLQASYEVAENRFYNKDYKGAVLFASKSIELDSIAKIKTDNLEHPKSFLIRASAFMKTNNFKEAFMDYSRYLSNQYTNEFIWWKIRDIFRYGDYSLIELGYQDKAIEFISKIIDKNSYNSYYYFTRGELYFKNEKYRDAILDYDKAIDLYLRQKGDGTNEFDYTNYEFYYSFRAEAKSKLKEYKGAIDDYTEAIKIVANDYLFYERAMNKNKLQDYGGAISDYTKYIEMNPSSVEAYILRGDAKYNIYNYKGAIADYTKAISLDPKNAEAYLWRGHAKIQIKDKIGACKDFSKAGDLGEVDAYKAINANCN